MVFLSMTIKEKLLLASFFTKAYLNAWQFVVENFERRSLE